MTTLQTLMAAQNKQPEAQAALVNHLLSMAKTIRQMQAIVLAPIGVAVGQDQFLLALVQNGSQMSSTVAQILNVRPSTISKMTDVCERKGWIRRSVDIRDLRRTYIDLTDEGMLMANKIQSATAVLEKELALLFADHADTSHVIKQLNAILPKILKRLR